MVQYPSLLFTHDFLSQVGFSFSLISIVTNSFNHSHIYSLKEPSKLPTLEAIKKDGMVFSSMCIGNQEATIRIPVNFIEKRGALWKISPLITGSNLTLDSYTPI